MEAGDGVGRTAKGDDEAVSVWYCIPSARPAAEAEAALSKWRAQGYKIALFVDPGHTSPQADYIWEYAYPGYAKAVNFLVHRIMRDDDLAEWFVTGGDDMHPDANHTAEEIANECYDYFWGNPGSQFDSYQPPNNHAGLFGVMQPTGDKWGDRQGPYSERVCGSPWMGREFCRRIYSGRGPIWPEFDHMFEDEHLFHVAKKLGILWQRSDLIHYHDHWVRRHHTFDSVEQMDRLRPAHLAQWNTSKHWNESKAIFERLKAGGFEEAEDLLP
jgi:hypothetical protein